MMVQGPPPFASILCAVDGSEEAGVAAEQAVALAAPDARLTFLTVSDASSLPPAADALAPALRTGARAGLITESLILHATDVHAAILGVAADHDLLVLGAHGRHRLPGHRLGGAAGAALYHCAAPVLVARPAPGPGGFPRRVLLATDGTPAMDETITIASALARRHRADVVLLHVGTGSHAIRHGLAEQATELLETTGSEPVTLQLDGHAPARVVETARELASTLIITGNDLRTGIRALGSVSERIAATAPCSVLVVRR
jgi:nucleotide-binding universal stress UspA family protein